MAPLISEEDISPVATEESRKPWQPLGFEKIDAAKAESGFTGTAGVDNTFYS